MFYCQNFFRVSNICDLPKTKALCSSEQEVNPPVSTIKGHFCRSKLSQTSLIVIHFILFLPRVLLAGENALHEIVEVSSLVFITLCQRSGQFRDLTFISQWAKIQIVPIEWLCVRTRGGRRYQIFETATATSATLADFFTISIPLRATPLPLPRVYFCGTKSFSSSFSEFKNSQKHYLNYTWSCLTCEPHLTTPYKAAVLVMWPEGICRRLRSRGNPALRCDELPLYGLLNYW